MYNGKKGIAEKILYGALAQLGEKTNDEPLKAFEKVVENVKPQSEVKARRVGGATYQVPMDVRPDRQISLALRWLISYPVHAVRKVWSPNSPLSFFDSLQ